MSVCAEALEELMGLGVTGAALVAAIRRLEQAAYGDRIASLEAAVEKSAARADAELMARRERDRERKRSARVRGIPRTSADIGGQKESPRTPKENTPIPPLKGGTFPAESELRPEKPKEAEASAEVGVGDQAPLRSGRRKSSRPIGEGFPTEALIDAAQTKAAEVGADLDCRREAERFRNWALGKDARYADWAATWRNWVDKAIGWAPKIAGPPIREGPKDPWPERLTRWNVAGYWDADWGPKPGRDGYCGPLVEAAAATTKPAHENSLSP